MKHLISLTFLIFISTQITFGQNEIENLDSSVVIGEIINDQLVLYNDQELKNYIDQVLNPDVRLFDSIHLKVVKLDSTKFYFIELTRIDKKMTLVKWLEERENLLYIGYSFEPKYEFLTAYKICQGEASCFPRLMNIEGVYHWSCREDPSCVSPEYAKEHPCKSITTIFE